MNGFAVRYIVDDVDAAVEFYTTRLGFDLRTRPAPGSALLQRSGLRLLLNAPGRGEQETSDGARPEPGGWNRFQVEVDDLGATVAALRRDGAEFRGDIVEGKSGKQILLLDPAGNPVELFEPVR